MREPLPLNPAIDILHLTHRYQAQGTPALDDLSLRVPAQRLFGILGPNGGGKTTLFRILTTLLRPTHAQQIRMLDWDLLKEPHAVRSVLGVVFQSPSLDGQLTVRENLLHHGQLYGLRGRCLQQRIAEVLTCFQLTDRAGELVNKLSGGLQRRVEIAKALLPQPQLLLLDEPSTGLDPGARRDLSDMLRNLREQQVTVVLTTHFMEEADRCDELSILHQGRLIRGGSPHALKAEIGGQVVTLTPADPADGRRLAQEIIARWGPWTPHSQPRLVDQAIRLEHGQGAQLAATIASAFPGRLSSLQIHQPTLEDVFLHATGRKLHH